MSGLTKAKPAEAHPERTGEPSIGASAVRASAWVMAGHMASQVLRFVSNIILARLLFPEAFGLSSLVFVFTTGLHMFSDIGTGPAIVQSPRGDDASFLNTAWTLAFMRSLLIFAGTCVIAHPVATLYGQPLLARLLPIAGLDSALGGLQSTNLQTALRHLRMGRRTLLELVSQAAGSISTILFALAYRSLHPDDHLGAVWAIIGGTMAGTITLVVLSHAALPGVRNRFRFDRTAARQLFSFGRWVFASSLLAFLAGQADRLMFGKLLPLEVLGVYGIAMSFSMLTTQVVQKLGSFVLFPAFSRVVERGGIRQAYLRARLPVLLGGGVIASGLVACGPHLIRLLYNTRYAQAGWMLQYLAVAAWFQVLESSNCAVLLAQGRLPWMAAENLAKLVALIVFLPLGLKVGGLPGAIAGLVITDVLKYLVSAVAVALHRMQGFGQDLWLSAGIAGVSAAGLLAGGVLQGAIQARIGGLLGGGAVVGGASLAAGLWYLRRIRAERATGIVPPALG
jgi:O-antigen/teichoic acid export membrane protein